MIKFFIKATLLTLTIIFFVSCAYLDKDNIKGSKQITPTILLSVDGFANDYLERFKPKNILKLAETGVKAKSLISMFPSKTFPNHISIVTGNYPSTHGVIHNNFYNRDLDANYKKGAGKEDPNWLKSQTLWSLAEKNNVKTAIYFWPESEVGTKKHKPSYVKPYIHNTPNVKRFNQMVDWLKLPLNERPSLILGYFSTIDGAGHHYGTTSNELKVAIAEFDELLGEFIHRLKTELSFEVNIVLVSDHGMTDISADAIRYEHLFEGLDDIRVINGQTQLFVYLPDDQMANEEELRKKIQSNLSKAEKKIVNVYSFDNYPLHWNFNSRSSVMPNLVLEALPPYVFGKLNEKDNATHGYDPRLTKQLNAIFIANGPSFKNKLVIEPFNNIDIFPMILSILNIELPKNIDADPNILLPILK